MSKTPSNKLFRLIKSLSGSEKRYFKLYISDGKSGKTSKYVQLFDAIDLQEVYDDEALRALIYKDEEIQSRKFSELKAYLYELILKSLQNFDEKTSVEFRLKGMLQSVRALYKRSHYADCKALLVKVKKLADRYEAFLYIIEALSWDKQIAYAQSDISFLDKHLPRLEQEEKKCLEQLQNISAFRNIFYRLIVSIRKDPLMRSEEKMTGLKDLINNPLLSDIDQALSFKARLLYYRIYGIYYYSILEYDKVYDVSKKGLELMESFPHLLKEDVSEYISLLSNFTACCGIMNRYDEVAECLHKFQKIKAKTLNDELRIHIEYYSKKFSLCIFTGDFKSALGELLKHQKESQRFDEAFFEKGRFYYQYFYIYFGIGDYDKALEYLNEWLNLPRSMERQDLQSLSRILNLITHFEMGNTLLLEYLLRSTYRYLRSRNRIFLLEKSVLNFISESNKIRTRSELKDAFRKLKKEFEQLAQIPSEKIMFQYFDFIAWLESKIEGKSFPEIVRQRYDESRI